MNLSTQSKCPMCGGGRTHAEGTTSYGRCGSNWGPAWDTGVVKVFNQAPECRIGELENQMRNMVRLDDPVVTGLVEALKSANKWVRRIDDRQDDLPGSFIPFGTDPSGSVRGTRAALSAYEARVKEVSRE